jgi:hypothetical protein
MAAPRDRCTYVCALAVNEANQQFVNTACGSNTYDYYSATWGYPTPITTVYYVNRPSFATRIITSNAQLELFSQNGTMVASQAMLSSATVSTFTFNPPVPASTPSATDPVQMSPLRQQLDVRYIRINAAPGQCLHFWCV